MQTYVCVLLTKRNGYGIMREYRWKYRLYSFAVPQSWYGVLFLARRGAQRKVFRACGERSSPRCFCANCAAPEPSERRAKTTQPCRFGRRSKRRIDGESLTDGRRFRYIGNAQRLARAEQIKRGPCAGRSRKDFGKKVKPRLYFIKKGDQKYAGEIP